MKIRVVHPWPCQARFHDATRLSCPCWVMPQHPPSTGSKKVVIMGFGGDNTGFGGICSSGGGGTAAFGGVIGPVASIDGVSTVSAEA